MKSKQKQRRAHESEQMRVVWNWVKPRANESETAEWPESQRILTHVSTPEWKVVPVKPKSILVVETWNGYYAGRSRKDPFSKSMKHRTKLASTLFPRASINSNCIYVALLEAVRSCSLSWQCHLILMWVSKGFLIGVGTLIWSGFMPVGFMRD